jgi:hypothetical protein
MQRRCGWLMNQEGECGRPVWGRGEVVLWTCPKSFISAESQTLVEEFLFRRRMGMIDIDNLNAKQAEAFAMLEREFSREMNDGHRQTR